MSFVTLFTSCKEEHNVPPFPEELTNYFPYKKGESFSFVSEDKDTLTSFQTKHLYLLTIVIHNHFFLWYHAQEMISHICI